MKKFIILLPVLFIFSCAPEYYTPQSMFNNNEHPNKNRKEGDYSHEFHKTKKVENYIPQLIKQEEIEKQELEDYIPQAERKSLILPIDPKFIGTWVASNPDNAPELIVITLLSNNNATSYEINSGQKSNPVTFTWFHKNNTLGYFLNLSQYSYTYYDVIENQEDFYVEYLKENGFKYEWINNDMLKLFTEEGPIFFERQN